MTFFGGQSHQTSPVSTYHSPPSSRGSATSYTLHLLSPCYTFWRFATHHGSPYCKVIFSWSSDSWNQLQTLSTADLIRQMRSKRFVQDKRLKGMQKTNFWKMPNLVVELKKAKFGGGIVTSDRHSWLNAISWEDDWTRFRIDGTGKSPNLSRQISPVNVLLYITLVKSMLQGQR